MNKDGTTNVDKRPKLRSHSEPLELGFWEPPSVPIGKVTLKNALQFLADHINDPLKHDAKSIARQYNLDPRNVGKKAITATIRRKFANSFTFNIAELVLKYVSLMKLKVDIQEEIPDVDLSPENVLPETPLDKLAEKIKKSF